MKRLVLTAALLAITAGSGEAQDKPAAEKLSPAETKQLLDNAQMRVLEVRFKPGAKSSEISHPNRFIYALSDGALVFSPAGKRAYELSFSKGEALYLPAETTATRNESDQEVRALVVEVKGADRGSAMSALARGKGKAAGKARNKLKTVKIKNGKRA
jgi:quercetin dioxygenase-like cupin family protein